MSFLDELLNDAKAAMAIAQPIIGVAASAAPVVAGIFPSTAPAIAAIEAGAAAIAKVAPTAVNDANALIDEGKQILADLGPVGQRLSDIYSTLFQKHTAVQTVVLSPVTTAPTAPAST